MNDMTAYPSSLDIKTLKAAVLTPDQLGLVRTASELLLRADERLQTAKKCIAHAQAEAERSGYLDGMTRAQADKAETLMRLECEAAERWALLEDSIVKVAIGIVRRIAERLGSEAFLPALAETALAEVKTCSQVVLRVSPLAAPRVAKHLNDLGSTLSHPRSFEVQADASLDDFACVLESELGFVAADLDIQLHSIEKILHSPRMEHL